MSFTQKWDRISPETQWDRLKHSNAGNTSHTPAFSVHLCIYTNLHTLDGPVCNVNRKNNNYVGGLGRSPILILSI